MIWKPVLKIKTELKKKKKQVGSERTDNGFYKFKPTDESEPEPKR